MKVKAQIAPAPHSSHWTDGIKKTLVKALALPTFLDLPSLAPPMPLDKAEELEFMAEPGDIVLTSEKALPLYQILSKVALGSDFGHVGLYVGDGMLIEAGPSGVKTRPLFANGSHLTLVKPRYKNPEDRWKAVDYAYQSLDKPYDWLSRNQGDSLTCTDLVMNAVNQGETKFEVPEKNFMGHRLVSPQAFVETPNMEVAVESNSPWYKSLAGSLPVIGLTAAGGVAGKMIGGWIGCAVGTVATYSPAPLGCRPSIICVNHLFRRGPGTPNRRSRKPKWWRRVPKPLQQPWQCCQKVAKPTLNP